MEDPGIRTSVTQGDDLAFTMLQEIRRITHVTSVIHNSSDRTLIVGTLLSIAAVILVIAGAITVLSGSVIAGIVLIVIACIVGPGGYSLSRR